MEPGPGKVDHAFSCNLQAALGLAASEAKTDSIVPVAIPPAGEPDLMFWGLGKYIVPTEGDKMACTGVSNHRNRGHAQGIFKAVNSGRTS